MEYEGSKTDDMGDVKPCSTMEELIHSTNTITDTLNVYKKWGKQYSNDITSANYRGPYYAGQYMSELMKDKRTKILDVCAGTGLVGQQLREKGFINIDALDACPEMLQEAKNSGIYSNYFCTLFTKNPQDIPADTYDAITIAGSFAQGHLEPECLVETVRLVKPGGIVMITNRVEVLEESSCLKGLQPSMEKLEKEKAWKLVKKEILPNYYAGREGMIYVYRVLDQNA